MQKRKVLVIGLDGADPLVLENLIKERRMPFLASLIDKGAYGPLISTVPMITPVAWTSFITGKNPGKHNIFGFVNFKKGSYERKILTSIDRKSETLWHILNRYGIKVGLLNFPSLYPPEKIDGFMVCGMLTPNIKSNFTYPSSLKKELFQKIKNYEIDVAVTRAAKRNKHVLVKKIYELTQKRFEATKFFIENKQWDILITVFTETDRIQHFFWRSWEQENSKFKNVIPDYFQYIDKILEKLVKLVKNYCDALNIFIVSDHGLGSAETTFYVNNWLVQQGLLKIKRNSLNYIKHIVTKKIIERVSTLAVKLRFDPEFLKNILFSKLAGQITYLYCYSGGIDWENTKAYFSSGLGEGIVINLKDKFLSGIVSQKDYESTRQYIIKQLQNLKDPLTDKKIVKKVYRKEEVFSGRNMDRASDLIILLREGYMTAETISESGQLFKRCTEDELVTGEHRKKGIFLAYGPDINSFSKIENMRIYDVAPSILHLFGIVPPNDMDGKVLPEIFTEDNTLLQNSEKESKREKIPEKRSRKKDLDRKDQEEVKRRLRALGYLE